MLKDLGAPRSTLTDRLNTLVKFELMERRPYKEAGERARSCYVLTKKGKDLAPIFMAMTQWGEDHILKSASPVQIIDTETGQALKLDLVDQKGNKIPPSQAVLSKRP